MLAKDLMTAQVFTLDPEATVGEAMTSLVQHGISGVPVVEKDGRIFGVLTEEDLLLYYEYPEECHLDAPIRNAKVLGAGLVTRSVISVTPDTQAADVATLFIGRKIKRVPVMKDGKLLGILSRRDLLKGLLELKKKTG
jgi:CBS domain-containing protein